MTVGLWRTAFGAFFREHDRSGRSISSAPAKTGPRACPWLEQGQAARRYVVTSCRHRDDGPARRWSRTPGPATFSDDPERTLANGKIPARPHRNRRDWSGIGPHCDRAAEAGEKVVMVTSRSRGRKRRLTASPAQNKRVMPVRIGRHAGAIRADAPWRKAERNSARSTSPCNNAGVPSTARTGPTLPRGDWIS